LALPIDAPQRRLYIAAHDVVEDHRSNKAPPPSRHGTSARSRVKAFVPPAPRHFHPRSARGFGF